MAASNTPTSKALLSVTHWNQLRCPGECPLDLGSRRLERQPHLHQIRKTLVKQQRFTQLYHLPVSGNENTTNVQTSSSELNSAVSRGLSWSFQATAWERYLNKAELKTALISGCPAALNYITRRKCQGFKSPLGEKWRSQMMWESLIKRSLETKYFHIF